MQKLATKHLSSSQARNIRTSYEEAEKHTRPIWSCEIWGKSDPSLPLWLVIMTTSCCIATPWWQVWDWKYDWLILQNERKFCAFLKPKVNFAEDRDLIEVSLHPRFEWRLGQMRIAVLSVPLPTALLCINLCLEVTDSENGIRSVSSHQYLSRSEPQSVRAALSAASWFDWHVH